jgi:hypothetical protein
MPFEYVKAAGAVAWGAAVCGAGLAIGFSSIPAWAALGGLAVLPPLLMRRYWKAPAQSLSESIQEVLR